MATIYPLKPRELFEVPKDDTVTVCKMCLEPSVPNDGVDLGPLYQYGHPIENESDIEVYSAHHFCLLFAPGLHTNGEDEEGIKGFLPPDILKEWRRGMKLKCSYCTKSYATVGCFEKHCRRTYHLSCGIRHGSHQEFCDPFSSYCHEHRREQKIYKDKSLANLPRECGMCFEMIKSIRKVSLEERKNHLWSPCCGKWFHLTCIQKMALSAGYFFKCPLCNNKDEFENEMKLFGVYVPEQDAAWEREGNMYEDIYQRHGSCDAEDCSCPHGRDFDEDYTIWEIILCKYCGSQGVHVRCGNLPLTDDVKWKCSFCADVVKNMPPRAKHNFVRVKQKKSSRKVVMQKLLERTTFKVSGNRIALSSSQVHASVQICPNFEVPKPVKLFKCVKESSKELAEKLVDGNVELNPILGLTHVQVESPAKYVDSPTKLNLTPFKEPAAVVNTPIKVPSPILTSSPITSVKTNIHHQRMSSKQKQSAQKKPFAEKLTSAEKQSELETKPLSENQPLASIPLKRKLSGSNADNEDICVIKDKFACREDNMAKLKQNSILNYFCAKNQ